MKPATIFWNVVIISVLLFFIPNLEAYLEFLKGMLEGTLIFDLIYAVFLYTVNGGDLSKQINYSYWEKDGMSKTVFYIIIKFNPFFYMFLFIGKFNNYLNEKFS